MAESAPRGNDALIAALADANRTEGKMAVMRELARADEILLLLLADGNVAVTEVGGVEMAMFAWTSGETLRAAFRDEGQSRPIKGTVLLAEVLDRNLGLSFDAGQPHSLTLNPSTVKALFEQLAASGELHIHSHTRERERIVLAPPSVTLGTRERDHMDAIRRARPHLTEAWLVESTDSPGCSSLAAVVVGLGPDDHDTVNAIMALVLEPLDQSRPPRVIPAPQPDDPDLLSSARRVGIRLV